MHGPDLNLSDRDFGNPVRLRLESNEDYIRVRDRALKQDRGLTELR